MDAALCWRPASGQRGREVCLRDPVRPFRRFLLLVFLFLLASCAGSGDSFTDWRTEEFGTAAITESRTKTFLLGNSSGDKEQHLLGVAFDRGTNAAGHFRLERVMVGNQQVDPTDVVVPPGSTVSLTVTYAPVNLEPTAADWGGWVTGAERRWIPVAPEDAKKSVEEEIVHRAIIEAVYDHPTEGIFYLQVVGEAKPGPHGETEAGGAFASCEPGGGVACYTGGFALDIPQLAPGGPKLLEMSGPIRFGISGGAATLAMDDFPLILSTLRSEEVPQLPSGVSATLVISGAQGKEATGMFDGARLTLTGAVFRIRVALGELTVDQLRGGFSAIVDFELPDLEITTIKPLNQGAITMHLETSIPQNPSGNELFDQFLSGAKVVAIMEGELAL